jgi:hypothetical protein
MKANQITIENITLTCEQVARQEAEHCLANDGGLTAFGAELAHFGREIDQIVANRDRQALWEAEIDANYGEHQRIVAHGWKLMGD